MKIFIRERNILQIAICSVKTKCNCEMVSSIFLFLYLYVNIFIEILLQPTRFSSSPRFLLLIHLLLLRFFSSSSSSSSSFQKKIHYHDHEEERMWKRKTTSKQEQGPFSRSFAFLFRHIGYYSTQISFQYEITVCYSYRLNMFLLFNFK